jgi:hypothetical protein
MLTLFLKNGYSWPEVSTKLDDLIGVEGKTVLRNKYTGGRGPHNGLQYPYTNKNLLLCSQSGLISTYLIHDFPDPQRPYIVYS